MTLYIILIFSAICVGMAISVKAFGTGGKRKRIFQDIYFSIEEVDGIGVLYGCMPGETKREIRPYSCIIRRVRSMNTDAR